MSLQSLSTGSRTALVGVGLVAVYIAYSQMTSPFLAVERKTNIVATVPFNEEKSAVFAEQAQMWFKEDPWVQTSNGRFRDGGRLLFFDKHELFSDNRQIRIHPVAMMWQQTKGDIPVTMTADSAQLDASTKFSFEDGHFGKITSGLLAGDVRITGPDGLRIEGRMFHISEDAMKVWTKQPVKFQWGTHTGRSDGGAEIELLASADSSNTGLLAVDAVQRIRLNGRIDCNLMFQEKDSEREPVLLNVNAANGFEFFVPTKEATFYGFVDRKPTIDNQILIERPGADGSRDRLFCSKLVLNLQPKVSNAETEKASNQLELARITAEGTPVEYLSSKNGEEKIYARMNVLSYQLETRILELKEGAIASTGRPIRVEVHQAGSKLTTGRVLVGLTEKNEVHTVECRTAGQIGPTERGSQQRDSKSFDATWSDSLVLRRDNKSKVTLTGNARVEQNSLSVTGASQDNFGLAAQVIEMLLDNVMGSSDIDRDEVVDQVGGTEPFNMASVRPRKLMAMGDVKMKSGEILGTARDRLTVDFRDSSAGAGNDAEANARSPVRPVSKSSSETPALSGGTTDFKSDTVEAVVIMSDGEQPEFEDVWLKGNVFITHKDAQRKDRNLTAEGNALFAKGGFAGQRRMNLFGDPATVVYDSNRVDGQRIDLTELKNDRQVKVEGSGRIRFLVERGLDGTPLAKPSPLDIYWGDHMNFIGRTAHFVGNIRAVMNNEVDHDLELTCAGMKVHLADDIDLQKLEKDSEIKVTQTERSTSPIGGIERIECESRVIVDIDMMENGVVQSHHHAEFTDLEFNHITGDFRALGPGLIDSTQPDKGKVKLAPSNRAVASANTPIKTSENAFVYLHATFIGELEGNRNQSFVRLKQHVQGVFGPVRQLGDRIDIDGMSVNELPDKTGSLSCENLSVSRIPGLSENDRSFSLVAESNSGQGGSGTHSPCRLGSREFAGEADKITYDHSKQQFILRADEGRQAKVTLREDNGEPRSVFGRGFAYYSDTHELTANEVTGVQGSGAPR